MKTFHDLEAWRESIELVSAVYAITTRFPASENYGLASQMRRAAISIASNIAEGYGRRTLTEWRHYLFTARGSLFELATQMIISERLGYCSAPNIDLLNKQQEKTGRILSGLINHVERRIQIARSTQ